MADIVVITVVIIVVPTISVGATDLYCIRIAITVVGISVNPDVFNAKKVIIDRSEEHPSELQSRGHLVCRLLIDPCATSSHTLSLHDALPIFIQIIKNSIQYYG